MSYTGKIEDLIAERDELRATLTAVSDALDYLHGMTPQQAAKVRKEAERYRWLRDHACTTQANTRGPIFRMDVQIVGKWDIGNAIDAALAAAPAVG